MTRITLSNDISLKIFCYAHYIISRAYNILDIKYFGKYQRDLRSGRTAVTSVTHSILESCEPYRRKWRRGLTAYKRVCCSLRARRDPLTLLLPPPYPQAPHPAGVQAPATAAGHYAKLRQPLDGMLLALEGLLNRKSTLDFSAGLWIMLEFLEAWG